MYKRVKKKKIGVKATHRRALRRNMLTSLLESGKVETTTAKAKFLKSKADNFFSKVNEYEGLSLVRYLKRNLTTVKASKVAQLFSGSGNVSVRIVKSGFRKGDNAELSIVSIEGYDDVIKKSTKKKSTKKSEDKEKSKKDTK